MRNVVVVGYGIAGRAFHIPLIRRTPDLHLAAVATRDPTRRAEAERIEDVPTFASLGEALRSDRSLDLVVVATPHDSHPALAIEALDAGRDCVVDKVMCLTTASADRMIEARDRSGKMLSVFHNRRWDWDFVTLRAVIESGRLGVPRLFESSVCRYSPPRTWRGNVAEAGTILHDWGAHLVDQALQLNLGPCRRLRAWLTPAPWEGVDSGGHGRIVLDFDSAVFQVETSRIASLERPRWWVLGDKGGFVRWGVDPQEDALRSGDIGQAADPPGHGMFVRTAKPGAVENEPIPPVKASWDAYYRNIADHLVRGVPLEVTAEQAREVVRVLEAATASADNQAPVEGPWGFLATPPPSSLTDIAT